LNAIRYLALAVTVKQRLFNLLGPIAAGISLLLTLGCIGFWVFTLHDLYLTGSGDPAPGTAFWTFGSAGGRFQVVYDNGVPGATPLGNWSFAGIEYGSFNSGWNVWLPWWLPTALLFIAPMLWTWRVWRNARRHTGGVCPICGYDLRATPDQCPECGHVADPPAKAI
jgi:hypothetical protein